MNALGVDIGATKILGVLVTPDGRVASEVKVGSPAGGEAVLAATAEVIADVGAAAAGSLPGVVGVGIPGLVDTRAGSVRHAVNLGVADGFPFAERLAHVTGMRVVLDNDVNAAALGAGRLLGQDDLVYLSIGTGLAAASITGGQLRRGARDAAGEIGHIPVDPAGPPCECGQVGCLETVASGSALATLWPGSGRPPAEALFDAADDGDARAIEVAARFAAHVADAVRLLALTIDPEVVVLGGGVAQVGERLLTAVSAALAVQAGRSPFLASLDLADRLVLAPQHLPVAAIGAALLGSVDD